MNGRMLVTVIFLAFVGLVSVIALFDWRRAWLLAVLVGVLQDPVRKMTPGTPVVLMFAVAAVFGVIVFSTLGQLQSEAGEFSRRFPRVSNVTLLMIAVLMLAAVNGLFSFGLASWKAPAMSLALYLAPIPAVLMAYRYADTEARIERFLLLFAIVTAIMLSGTFLEYFRVPVPGLGLVGWSGDVIRHLPGIQIRMLSGFYRAPDTMGLHAATLSSIGIAMAARKGFGPRTAPWLLAAAWGFTAVMVSGRRKALYFVAVFALVFVWRFFRRMKGSHVVAILLVAATLALVVSRIRGSEESSAYSRGAIATRGEFFARFEGGTRETIRQLGILGAGLGAATQGTQHFIDPAARPAGWQEGGLAKMAAELGVPGLLAVLFLLVVLGELMLRLTAVGDVPGSSQFMRIVLFALVVANGASFIASAQAYSDPFLLLLAAFFLGSLFATARLDEKTASRPVSQAHARATRGSEPLPV